MAPSASTLELKGIDASHFSKSVESLATGEVQNVSPQDTPLGHIHYFELKALGKQWMPEWLSDLPFST